MEDNYKTALENVVAAWESLPEGHYEPIAVQSWLWFDMKPAIDKAREELKNETRL